LNVVSAGGGNGAKSAGSVNVGIFTAGSGFNPGGERTEDLTSFGGGDSLGAFLFLYFPKMAILGESSDFY
jgi:hypothetical protein